MTGNWAPAAQPVRRRGLGAVLPGRAPGSGSTWPSKTQPKPSVAFVAYGIAASADAVPGRQTSACTAAGFKVSYVDFKVSYPGTTVATDVQRMKQAGSNFVVSCMDVQGNITMARAIKQYGLKATQLWLNGNDQSHAGPEPEPDAGRVLQHRSTCRSRRRVDLPGAEGVPDRR